MFREEPDEEGFDMADTDQAAEVVFLRGGVRVRLE